MPKPNAKDGFTISVNGVKSFELSNYLRDNLNHDLYMADFQAFINKEGVSKNCYIYLKADVVDMTGSESFEALQRLENHIKRDLKLIIDGMYRTQWEKYN